MSRRNNALAVDIAFEAIAPTDVLEGAPNAGAKTLGTFGGLEYGVWEMSAGGSTDIETEEVFIVLSGRATIEFTDRGERLDIAVGDIVHLHAGERTVWRVTEALRKVYFQHCEQAGQSK